jgi:endoglucanase
LPGGVRPPGAARGLARQASESVGSFCGGLTRSGPLVAVLVSLLVAPAVASAQLPAPGPLLPPEFAAEPERVPPRPVGSYPPEWARCVAERQPAPAVLPAGIDPRAMNPASPNPLLGLRWFVDRMEPAYTQWARWRRTGKTRKASLIWRVARQPRFRWFGKFTRPRMRKKVRGFLDRVQCDQPGTVPQMAVLRAEGDKCGSRYLGGGRAEDRRTRKWYSDFASVIGATRVVIGFEVDSLGTIDCLARHRRDDRLRLLRYGVDVLSRLPNATIYLEAGASDWKPARRTARMLRFIGVHKVRGFMLNVTHHDWTRANIRHGLDVSRRVGGKPFVISTANNGRGPLHYRRVIGGRRRRINVWCHPGRRGLGPPPTTRTSHPKVDAYLYINRPGHSAGSCNGGPAPAGTWWPARALMYARYATRWEGPPRGTRRGHYKRYTLRELGAFD